MDFDQKFAEGLPEAVHIEGMIEAKPLIENHKENVMDEPHQGVESKSEVTSPKRENATNAQLSTPNKDKKCDKKSTSKSIETNKSDKDFNVVRFAKIYDVKKKTMLDAIQQKEREQRAFHSKPAPNFQAIHAAVDRKRQQVSAKVTCPLTPSVLRRHAEKKLVLQKQVCRAAAPSCSVVFFCQERKRH